MASISDVVSATALERAGNVLVTGTSRESVRGVPTGLLDVVASDGDGAVAVTTRDAPETIRSRLQRDVPALDADRIGVVDCTPTDQEVRSNDGPLHWRLPSPMDLRGASMAVHECLAYLFENGVSDRHFCYDSLSRHLLGGDVDTVARYTHQLVGLTNSPGSIGVYPVYTNTTDDDDLDALTHLFGGVVEVRQRAGEREVRTRGLRDSPREWVQIGAPAPDSIGDVEIH